MELSKQEFDAILKLLPENRYFYFIKRVCDWEEMWTIYEDSGIVLNEDKNGNLSIFLFPFEPFASYYIQNTDELQSSFCKCITLDKFVEETIEKLLSHNVVHALIFPVPNGYGLNISLQSLKEDLNQELENY